MAPKRRAVASSSAGTSSQQQQQIAPIYAKAAAADTSKAIGAKTIVKEGMMAIVPTQRVYIQHMGWTHFVEAVHVPASRSLVREFFSNLAGIHKDVVFVRGMEVDILPAAIKKFYGSPDIPEDGFTVITQQKPLPSEVSASLTGADIDLHLNWSNITRGQLTVEPKKYPYFISTRLMPVSMGSKIQRV